MLRSMYKELKADKIIRLFIDTSPNNLFTFLFFTFEFEQNYNNHYSLIMYKSLSP